MKRKQLKGLQVGHFQHPTDATLQATLVNAIAGLGGEVQSLISNYETSLYARHMSSSLLVSEHQLPDLHRLLIEACEILDVVPPLLFVENNSNINAWTAGSKQTFLVATSALIEKVSESELLAIFGHELGHIKGHHIYYQALAQNAQSVLSARSEAASALQESGSWLLDVIGGLGNAAVSGSSQQLWNSLFEWNRIAEFTADRAALLVTQDLNSTLNVMAKLASGLNKDFNHDAFLQQALAFRNFGGSAGDFYRDMIIRQDTHPLIVLRAEELQNWALSDQYKDLTSLESDHPELRFVCRACGQSMVAPIAIGGQVIQCPTCESETTVPGVPAPPLLSDRTQIGI